MLFWLVLIPFVLVSLLLTLVILMQEPKQAGLGEGLGGGGGGGIDFGTRGGTAGGLQRVTIYLGVTWGVLALLLQAVPFRAEARVLHLFRAPR
jgi:preprotein translocase subunit SecG